MFPAGLVHASGSVECIVLAPWWTVVPGPSDGVCVCVCGAAVTRLCELAGGEFVPSFYFAVDLYMVTDVVY